MRSGRGSSTRTAGSTWRSGHGRCSSGVFRSSWRGTTRTCWNWSGFGLSRRLVWFGLLRFPGWLTLLPAVPHPGTLPGDGVPGLRRFMLGLDERLPLAALQQLRMAMTSSLR